MKKHYRWYQEHKLRLWTVVSVMLLAFACLPQAWAADGDYAAGRGAELTKYLHTHHLPLVNAQLLANRDGTRQVVLYGFTASDFGKQDAVTGSSGYGSPSYGAPGYPSTGFSSGGDASGGNPSSGYPY